MQFVYQKALISTLNTSFRLRNTFVNFAIDFLMFNILMLSLKKKSDKEIPIRLRFGLAN